MMPDIIAPVATVAGRYSASEVVTIIAAVGVLFSSIITGIVTVIGTLRNGQKTDKLIRGIVGDEQSPGLINQVAEVHTVVNSNLAALKAELSTANATNAQLISAVRDLKSERDKLAERTPAPVTVVVPVAPATTPGVTAPTMTVQEMNVAELNAPPKEKEKK